MTRISTLASSVLVLLVVASGCGRAHLFYDAREIQHPAFKKRDKRALVQQVSKKVGKRAVVFEDDGGSRDVSGAGLARLGVPELSALFLVTSLNDRGGESDIRVHVGRARVPVSVYVDLDGSMRVQSSARGRNRPGPASSLRDIASRFGLSSVPPGKWRDEERRGLEGSLASLTKTELGAVRTVQFTRKPKPTDGDHGRAALFTANGCQASITLFSTGVRSNTYRFIGAVHDPKSATLHSIVHEIGHAFEAADARERFCASRGKGVARANPLIAEGNRMLNDSPVVRAYAAVLGGTPAPTDYGNSSIRESFAESFALFFVDPAALQRTRPQVHAWFKRGGHILARQPLRR